MTVVIIGIVVIILAAIFIWGLSMLGTIGRPPVDTKGLNLPKSGTSSQGFIEAFEDNSEKLKHANEEHHLLERAFKFLMGWLSSLRVPFVSHDKRYMSILLLICTLLACLVGGSGLILSFKEWKAANLPEPVPAIGPLQLGETRELIPDMTGYGVYNIPSDVLSTNMIYSVVCQEDASFVFGFSQVERQVEVLLFVGVAEVKLSRNGEKLTVDCQAGSQLAIRVLPGLPQVPTTAPVGTETAPVSEVNQSAPQNEQPQTLFLSPVPAPVSGEYYVRQAYQPGMGYLDSTSGSFFAGEGGGYYSLIKTASCGQMISIDPQFQGENVFILIDLKSQVYGPTISVDGSGITVACDGSNPTILFVVVTPK